MTEKVNAFRSLLFVRDHVWRRFTHLKLRAHLLDLRALLFHHPRETRNSAFRFRDPRLLIAGFVEHGLRSSHLAFRVLVPGTEKDPPIFYLSICIVCRPLCGLAFR